MTILPAPGLDPVTGKLLGSLGSAVIGLFGGDGDGDYERQRRDYKRDRDDARQYARKVQKRDQAYARGAFVRLREDAVRAGFNPLTALGLTGGQYGEASGGAVQTAPFSPTVGPALSSRAFVAEALGSALETWTNRDSIRRDVEAERLRTELMREELEWMRDRRTAPSSGASYGFSVPAVVAGTDQAVGPALAAQRPRPRPSLGRAEIAFLPDGQRVRVPRAALDSIGVAPGGYINAGQYTELVGELRGEGESALAMGAIGETLGVPVFRGWGGEAEVHYPPLAPPRRPPEASTSFRGYAPWE